MEGDKRGAGDHGLAEEPRGLLRRKPRLTKLDHHRLPLHLEGGRQGGAAQVQGGAGSLGQERPTRLLCPGLQGDSAGAAHALQRGDLRLGHCTVEAGKACRPPSLQTNLPALAKNGAQVTMKKGFTGDIKSSETQQPDDSGRVGNPEGGKLPVGGPTAAGSFLQLASDQ